MARVEKMKRKRKATPTAHAPSEFKAARAVTAAAAALSTQAAPSPLLCPARCLAQSAQDAAPHMPSPCCHLSPSSFGCCKRKERNQEERSRDKEKKSCSKRWNKKETRKVKLEEMRKGRRETEKKGLRAVKK